MTLDEAERGPMYTRMFLIDFEVPDGTDTFWATKGQTLSGNADVYTAIMDADSEYRADEFTRLWTYDWSLGYRNTHWGDKAYQLGCEIDCADGQEFYDAIQAVDLGKRGNKFSELANDDTFKFSIMC
jgi:hypothetical protein